MNTVTDEATRPVTADDIWSDDLFGRRAEAELLVGYVESVWDRPTIGEGAKAYTIAVDAEYGEGKSFFLRRLARHLAIEHPVAFVDAWADDLADEPMTAIAATLKAALDPLLDEPKLKARWKTFVEKGGRVAKIAGIGLLKRGLGLLMTAPAVEAAAGVIDGLSDATQEAIDDVIEEAGADVAGALTSIGGTSDLLGERIRQFERGRKAVEEMKRSLGAVVESLGDHAVGPPIVVVIDELDRCRPTYAIKLLEEIKHLFDVPGLVFIFGLHGDQLAHSVSGAYGPGFDGKAYLRRFLQRRYTLAPPDLEPLVRLLLERSGINTDQISIPYSQLPGSNNANRLSLHRLVSDYMVAYGLHARDTFELVDTLQTCVVLSKGQPLHAGYLLPLIAGHMKGLEPGEIPPTLVAPAWVYSIFNGGKTRQELTIGQLASVFENISSHPDADLRTLINQDGHSEIVEAVFNARFHDGRKSNHLFAVERYPRLLSTVSRFTTPKYESITSLE